MNYFKDKSGAVFYYDDDQIKAGLADNKTAMTDDELQSHLNPAPTAEQFAEQARSQRAQLLLEADIMINVAEDAGADTKTIRAYRQALRDVPQQKGFPKKIKWPVAPGVN